MRNKKPYETLDVKVVEFMRNEDIITSSIVDNDGDYRDWETGGDAW
ncbi:MAG: hypothetical protein IJD77_02075 [Clostridia bacterium]|nr:hypothetical protein [Clostridia bacterium]